MVSRVLIFIALVALIAVPFALRHAPPAATEATDTVVVVSPHNEAIRHEFERGFRRWYRARTGRGVRVDWRVVGGTSDISRYLESVYDAAFEREWARRGRRWSQKIQDTFQSPAAATDPDAEVREARAAFLASNVSCGIDVFFGGDAYQDQKEAEAGRLVDAGLREKHAAWFRDDVIPRRYRGETFYDAAGRWYGVVLSGYGILYNRDALSRLHVDPPPAQWVDLGDPALVSEVGLADPTKSGSVCEAFENMIQQQMQLRLKSAGANPTAAQERQAVRDGWMDGLRLIQRLGANARYFSDSSQKPPIDVANGDCAVGLCIDFYGRQQAEAIRARGDARRLGFVMPVGGTALSTDPIALLRGAPHRAAAVAFLEFALSLDGQKLWAFKVGAPGGPERYALRRLPIRRDFYAHEEWLPERSDPADAPYAGETTLEYHAAWTGPLFREIGFVTRVLCQDTHTELVAAWRAINAAPEPRRTQALAVLERLDPVSYDRTRTEVHARLTAKDRVQEVQLATELGAYFRGNYARAAAIARGQP